MRERRPLIKIREKRFLTSIGKIMPLLSSFLCGNFLKNFCRKFYGDFHASAFATHHWVTAVFKSFN